MTNFDDFKLIAPLKKTLADVNYTVPTAIQAKAIPPALEGKDILGCAQTGTGKTAAFALPILNHMGKQNTKARPRQPETLVLAPTRELAIQIDESFSTYGQRLKLRSALVYGGVSQHHQVNAMRRGAHIVIATPGRLLDLMEQRYIDLRRLKYFVLDEVDRMLDMGFMPDIKRIIKCLPEQRQSLFFSATMPPAISDLAKQLLHEPVRINVTPQRPSVKKIEQRIVLMDRQARKEKLTQVVSSDDVDLAIVFTRTKRQADDLTKHLTKHKVRAAALHGNKSQNARQKALTDFQNGKIHVLVATDVASRGIDIEGVSHVINFELPSEPESYVHRIGRTGRAGSSGMAISFCTPSERNALRAIEKFIGKRLPVDDQRQTRSEKRRAVSKPRYDEASNASDYDRPPRKKPGFQPKVETQKKRKQRKGRNERQRLKQPVA